MTTARRRYNLAPVLADEPVYGACRHGHLGGDLAGWTAALREAGVAHVVCLLSRAEAARWGLPDAYADAFGVTHAPIRDRRLPDRETLADALEAIEATTAADDGIAVHCNAGMGRTGVVLAAWLVRYRDFEPPAAIAAVEDAGRAPREAVRCDNATLDELYTLLAATST